MFSKFSRFDVGNGTYLVSSMMISILWDVCKIGGWAHYHIFRMCYTQLIWGGWLKDKLCWILFKSHTFEIKTFYRVVCSKEGSYCPLKNIWMKKEQMRVSFFVLIKALRKSGETTDHLLLHYGVTNAL